MYVVAVAMHRDIYTMTVTKGVLLTKVLINILKMESWLQSVIEVGEAINKCKIFYTFQDQDYDISKTFLPS